MEWGREHAPPLLEANPDRLMSRRMSYFRLKRLRLGEAYKRFLEENLEGEGTILLSESSLKWPTTKVGERHVFQFGGVGGATPEEFLEGGERPEAEWGFERELRKDVVNFARERGYKVRSVSFDAPETLSPFVADLYRWWCRRRGLSAERLLVESFALLEPYLTLRTGSAPYWTNFNTEPSADLLERYLDSSEPYDDIRLMLFSHGVESIGVTPIERWKKILQKARNSGEFVGVDEEKYPKDFATFVRYHTELKKLPFRPAPEPLTLGELDAFLREKGSRYQPRWS